MTKVLYIEHDDDNLYMLKMRFERIDGLRFSPPMIVIRVASWH